MMLFAVLYTIIYCGWSFICVSSQWKYQAFENIRVDVFERRKTSLCHFDTINIMTPANDSSSWGRRKGALGYLDMIGSMNSSKSCISLSILMSNGNEILILRRIFESNNNNLARQYRRVTLVHYRVSSVSTRNNRKVMSQRIRRGFTAKVRNTLLATALQDEKYVLWIDADVIGIPSSLPWKMIESQKDIVVARCNRFDNDTSREEYDANTYICNQQNCNQRMYLSQFVNSSQEFVKVDSVGGTFLLVKSEIHRIGINFPPVNVLPISMLNWPNLPLHREDFAIQTEGLCFMAMKVGYECYGMPHEIVVHV